MICDDVCVIITSFKIITNSLLKFATGLQFQQLDTAAENRYIKHLYYTAPVYTRYLDIPGLFFSPKFW